MQTPASASHARASLIRLPRFLAAAVFVLVLSACGGSDGGGTAGTSSNSSNKAQGSDATASSSDSADVRYAP